MTRKEKEAVAKYHGRLRTVREYMQSEKLTEDGVYKRIKAGNVNVDKIRGRKFIVLDEKVNGKAKK